jgi:hypothetical protein
MRTAFIIAYWTIVPPLLAWFVYVGIKYGNAKNPSGSVVTDRLRQRIRDLESKKEPTC